MTRNGWCRSNYHKDGKRRFGDLTNGLCSECAFKGRVANKFVRMQEKINDLESERSGD